MRLRTGKPAALAFAAPRTVRQISAWRVVQEGDDRCAFRGLPPA
jgi:hypothetical protein